MFLSPFFPHLCNWGGFWVVLGIRKNVYTLHQAQCLLTHGYSKDRFDHCRYYVTPAITLLLLLPLPPYLPVFNQYQFLSMIKINTTIQLRFISTTSCTGNLFCFFESKDSISNTPTCNLNQGFKCFISVRHIYFSQGDSPSPQPSILESVRAGQSLWDSCYVCEDLQLTSKSSTILSYGQ